MEEVKQRTTSAKQMTTDKSKPNGSTPNTKVVITKGSTPNTKVVKTSIDGQNVKTPEQRKVTGRIPKTKIVTESPDDKQKTTGQRKSHSGNRGRPASTVLTEYIAEHDDKQTPSNQRKSNRCKLDSTVLTEYNGARPKTTNTIEDKQIVLGDTQSIGASLQNVRKKTTHMKGKDQRQPKTQYTSLQLHVAPVGITIIAMNVDGKPAGPGTAERRKQAIQSIIENGRPYVVLFQEHKLEQIHKWKKYPIPAHYVYTGNQEASLLFDIRNISFDDIRDTEIRKIVEKLQRTPNNRLLVAFPGDFNPIPRMCMKIVKTKGAPLLEFICVSWHGRWNNGFSKEKVRKSEFIYFMEFLRVVHEQYHLALLVGGDFNIDLHVIETEIKPPFVLYKYSASSRRLLNGIKDYFISTSDLLLTNIKYISLQNETKALNPEDVLDHDPLIAHLSNTFPQQTVAQQEKLL